MTTWEDLVKPDPCRSRPDGDRCPGQDQALTPTPALSSTVPPGTIRYQPSDANHGKMLPEQVSPERRRRRCRPRVLNLIPSRGSLAGRSALGKSCQAPSPLTLCHQTKMVRVTACEFSDKHEVDIFQRPSMNVKPSPGGVENPRQARLGQAFRGDQRRLMMKIRTALLTRKTARRNQAIVVRP